MRQLLQAAVRTVVVMKALTCGGFDGHDDGLQCVSTVLSQSVRGVKRLAIITNITIQTH